MKTIKNIEYGDLKAKVVKTDFIQIADIMGQSWIDPLKRFRILYKNKEIIFNTPENMGKFRQFLFRILFGNLIIIEDSKKNKHDDSINK